YHGFLTIEHAPALHNGVAVVSGRNVEGPGLGYVSAATAGANMVCLMAARVPGSLAPSGVRSSIAAETNSPSGAVASTMPAAAASTPPQRRPVVIDATAVCGVSLAWISAAMPGVKGMRMSTSGKQK